MGFFDFLKTEKKASDFSKEEYLATLRYNPILSYSYDGEKTPGEIGKIKKYNLDYQALKARSWQSYLESEITQDVVNKFVLWVIGSGLKLQSEPIEELLKNDKINVDTQKLSKLIESKWNAYSKSKDSDKFKIDNLNRLAKKAFINAIVGGDVLVINRLKKGKLSTQLIDGSHVVTPYIETKATKEDRKAGNIIKNGIVTNKRGEIIAYYVKEDLSTYKRVKARTTNKYFSQAFLVYGLRYRLDDNRGIPLISAVLETLKKLDRYQEAAVASAEETAKVSYYIKHNDSSTGESPLAQNMIASMGLKDSNPALSDDGSQVANKIAATTQKQVFNLTPGADLQTLDSKSELYFKEFYTTNINMVCAAIGIPPEVALSKYDSNFSASRAALKDWEHTIKVNREDFQFQFYQPIYEFWLGIQVLTGKVTAEGYAAALIGGNDETLFAYNNARFVGANVPHIDPLKEVLAERAKLGELGKTAPLTTIEAATEALAGGEYDQNVKQFLQEIKDLPKAPEKNPAEIKKEKKEEKKDD
jgi:capsid protein